MPVDMLLSKFKKRIGELYPENVPFVRQGRYDEGITNLSLPPYRAIFDSLCTMKHAEGYLLPSFADFRDAFARTLMTNGRFAKDLSRLYEDPKTCTRPTEGFLYRLCSRYEDGMAHLQLYCALVMAYEDVRRIGMVVMDVRMDFKLKTDLLVTLPRPDGMVCVRVDIGQGQPKLLASREAVEAQRKGDAAGSSHWANPVLNMPTAYVERSGETLREWRGLRFFVPSAVDRLIADIDTFAAISEEGRPSYAEMKGMTMYNLKTPTEAVRVGARA